METTRKLKTKTYEEKYDICKFYDENPSMKKTAIAARFNVRPTTLQDILKNKAKIYEKMENPDVRKGNIKRLKKLTFEDVDAALILWIRQASNNPSLRIDGEMLLTKATYFKQEFGEETSISMGWVYRFKKRWGIVKVQKCGESGGVNNEVVAEWKENKLKDILDRYSPRDIYNADERGLFWKILPERSLGFIGEKYYGSKQEKARVTIFVCANMDGSDKLPMLCIGKYKKPRAFKNVHSLPCPYEATKKAWMTSPLFQSWVRKLDRRMLIEGRKIALLVDNCSAHPVLDELDNIELIFLPPNTTSVLQPMDAGIIKNLKFHYRKYLAARRLNAYENNSEFSWNLLDCMLAVRNAWRQVSRETVANCFQKCGFDSSTSDSDDPVVIEDDHNNPEEVLDFQNIFERLSRFTAELPSVDQYVSVDEGISDVLEELTDTEIVTWVQESTRDADNEDDGDDS